MRGEYFFKSPIFPLSSGSPPHARGIPPFTSRRDGEGGITPACAGNTTRLSLERMDERDHPRMRGEYRNTG